MRVAIALAVVCATAAPVLGQTAVQDAETELRRLTEQRFAANAANDRAFYEHLLADNFKMLGGHQPPVTKRAYLEAEFPAELPGQRAPASVSGFEAVVSGDTAVVTYEVTEAMTMGDVRFEGHSIRMDTYARLAGAWRLLSMAAAERVSWPDVARVDSKLLQDYAGTYEVSQGTHVVVTSENGHLMASVNGEPSVELFPENDTTFFDTSDSPFARTIFERDASGNVVAQIYRAQGQRVRAARVR
jgi:hypothetical protein